MKKTLIALAAGLVTLSAVSAQAAAFDQNRPSQERGDNRSGNNGGGGQHRDDYGTWNSSWGSRPSAPPAHFKQKGNWYAHVRACQQRYRSYNPRTDRYTVRAGQTAVCTL